MWREVVGGGLWVMAGGQGLWWSRECLAVWSGGSRALREAAEPLRGVVGDGVVVGHGSLDCAVAVEPFGRVAW